MDEKCEVYIRAVRLEEMEEEEDIEVGSMPPPRPITNLRAVSVGMAAALVIITQGIGLSTVSSSKPRFN